MYSIALNRAYLRRITNTLAVVTIRQFPDPVSKGIYHSHPQVRSRCAGAAPGVSSEHMIPEWWYLLRRADRAQQPLKPPSACRNILPCEQDWFDSTKIPPRQSPGTLMSHKKDYVLLQRSAGSDQGLLVFPALTGSVTTLRIPRPVGLLVRQVCPFETSPALGSSLRPGWTPQTDVVSPAAALNSSLYPREGVGEENNRRSIKLSMWTAGKFYPLQPLLLAAVAKQHSVPLGTHQCWPAKRGFLF